MTTTRLWWGWSIAGLALVLAALALFVAPELGVAIGLAPLLAAVGNGWFAVAAVGVLGGILAIAVALAWLLVGTGGADVPDPEGFVSAATPGEELDEAVLELIGRRGRAARDVGDRDRIRDRLRRDAIATLVLHEGVDRPGAADRVAAGTWTNNRHAASFLGGPEVPPPPVTARLVDRLPRRDPFERAVRETVSAIDELAGDGR